MPLAARNAGNNPPGASGFWLSPERQVKSWVPPPLRSLSAAPTSGNVRVKNHCLSRADLFSVIALLERIGILGKRWEVRFNPVPAPAPRRRGAVSPAIPVAAVRVNSPA